MMWIHAQLFQLLSHSDSGEWGEEDRTSGISILRSTNMSNDGTIDFSNLTFRSVPDAKRIAKRLEPGDIILENSGGGPKQPVGRVCFFAGSETQHIAGNFCRRLRPISNLVLPRFLFWRLHYGHCIGDTLRYQTQTTGLRNLQFKTYLNQAVDLPAMSEQSFIAELLDEADRLRRLSRETRARAERILPALFLSMFGSPENNPKGLCKKPLGEIIHVKSGDFLSAKDMAADGQYPVYGGNGINGYHDRFMFPERKIVLGRVGAYCGVVHYSEPDAWVTDNALYVSEKLVPIDDIYLTVALKLANLNQYAGRAGQPLISGSRIYPIEILLPPMDHQFAFTSRVEGLTKLDGNLAKASEQLNHLWDVMLGKAFSGELTAKWREAHMKELLAEMEVQARQLNLPMPQEAAV